MEIAPQTVSTSDILLKLCQSISHVLSNTTQSKISHAGMIQSITRTCLKPDIGCFSIFDGGFSGLVVINFSAPAAMEIYHDYMVNMGMPESELAVSHTSDDVGNVMGELMNQMLGDFINKISLELQTSINQSQPKMLTINKELTISIDTNLDDGIAKRVSFRTANNHIFYLEFAMDQTEFIRISDFDDPQEFDLEGLLEEHGSQNILKEVPKAKSAMVEKKDNSDDLLDELGL